MAKRFKEITSWFSKYTFANLYRDVLENGLKIRVYERYKDGTVVIDAYEEYGWWIFKKKWSRWRYNLGSEYCTRHQINYM